MAAGCRLQDSAEDAEYIVEARIGTLGNDEHEIVYGVPANSALATAASAICFMRASRGSPGATWCGVRAAL